VNGEKKSAATPTTEKKKKKAGESSKGFDMDKLAEGLQKLDEDDLLQVVQMVHDHKTEESWMRNDIERELPSFCFWSGKETTFTDFLSRR